MSLKWVQLIFWHYTVILIRNVFNIVHSAEKIRLFGHWVRGYGFTPRFLQPRGWISARRPVVGRFAADDLGRRAEIQPLGCKNLGGTPNP